MKQISIDFGIEMPRTVEPDKVKVLIVNFSGGRTTDRDWETILF